MKLCKYILGEPHIFVFGGRSPDVTAFGDCYHLNTASHTWTQVLVVITFLVAVVCTVPVVYMCLLAPSSCEYI